MLTLVWTLIIFCAIIFIHEFGHFVAAKLVGVTVHEFSIGMGPKIFGFGKKRNRIQRKNFAYRRICKA